MLYDKKKPIFYKEKKSYRKLKRLLSVLLTIVMTFTCFPASFGTSSKVSAEVTPDGKYYADATFYDYKGMNEIGATASPVRPVWANHHYFFENFNQKVSDYAAANNMSYPLYFGDFNQFAGEGGGAYDNTIGRTLNGTSAYNFYWDVNRANRFGGVYSASLQGLADKNLNGNGAITQKSVELPYFNESFLNTQVNSKSIGTVVPGCQFPFKQKDINEGSDTGKYYVFDSSTDVVGLKNSSGKYSIDSYFDNDSTSKRVYDMDSSMGENPIFTKPGFFPFNDVNQSSKLSTTDPTNSLNYGFGLKLEIPFTLNADGKTDGNNTKFKFQGDDDVWIYIDGKLALDLGGAHSKTAGTIDFTKRETKVETAVEGTPGINNLFRSHSVKTDTTTIDEIFGNGSYDTSKVHTITMFYMERGMIESNMYVRFNFQQQNKLNVNEKIEGTVNGQFQTAVNNVAANETFSHNIKNDTTAVTGLNYDYKNVGGDVDSTKTMESGGNFLLGNNKEGDFANQLPTDQNLIVLQNPDATQEQKYDVSSIKVLDSKGGEIGTQTVTDGSTSTNTFKLYDSLIDPSAIGLIQRTVQFTNKVKTGDLNITKAWADEMTEADKTKYSNQDFNFNVDFANIFGGSESISKYSGEYYIKDKDGAYIQEGGSDKVYTATDGKIKVKPSQTAVIKNVPVLTNYTVTETDIPEGFSQVSNQAATGIISPAVSTAVFNNILNTQELVIGKSINDLYYKYKSDGYEKFFNDKYEELTSAEQTFVFKIDFTSKDGNTKKTFYETISFSKADTAGVDGRYTKYKTIKGIQDGTYTITEDTNWSWKYNYVKTVVLVNSAVKSDGSNNPVVLDIGGTIKSKPTVTFYNDRKTGANIPEGDTAINVNRITY